MYSKYSSGLFLLLLIGAALAHRDGRRRLSSIGPYLSLGVALLLFLPHLLWLVHNNFLPFEYAQERLERNPDYYPALISTVLMVAGQVIALLFALLLLIVLYDQRRAPSSAPAASFDRIFLSFAAFGPFILAFFMSLIFGYHIRDMWETPFWNFIGLWAIVFLRPALMPQDVRRFAMTLGVALCAALLVFIGSVSLGPYVSHKNNRMIFPGSKLSQNIIDTWHGRFRTPLHYVIGDVWPAGNVAWYADDRPHVFVDGEPKINPWIDPAQLKKEGGVVVWCIHCGERLMSEDMPSALKKKFPEAQIQPPLTLKRITYANVSPAVIGWALIPPEGRE